MHQIVQDMTCVHHAACGAFLDLVFPHRTSKGKNFMGQNFGKFGIGLPALISYAQESWEGDGEGMTIKVQQTPFATRNRFQSLSLHWLLRTRAGASGPNQLSTQSMAST
jgi:hypothetical protein